MTFLPDRLGQTLGGVTCHNSQPFVIRGMPLDPLGVVAPDAYAAEIDLGVRLPVALNTVIGADCESGLGRASGGQVELRAYGCRTSANAACTSDQARFVDEQLMTYQILAAGTAPPQDVARPVSQGDGPLDQTASAGPRAAIVRMGPLTTAFTCAQARAASFPAFD